MTLLKLFQTKLFLCLCISLYALGCQSDSECPQTDPASSIEIICLANNYFPLTDKDCIASSDPTHMPKQNEFDHSEEYDNNLSLPNLQLSLFYTCQTADCGELEAKFNPGSTGFNIASDAFKITDFRFNHLAQPFITGIYRTNCIENEDPNNQTECELCNTDGINTEPFLWEYYVDDLNQEYTTTTTQVGSQFLTQNQFIIYWNRIHDPSCHCILQQEQ